jgi:hypothetical protein
MSARLVRKKKMMDVRKSNAFAAHALTVRAIRAVCAVRTFATAIYALLLGQEINWINLIFVPRDGEKNCT